MNFKKFISGVSAFAIAASAFAGMAVTANAAEGDVTNLANVTFTGTTNGVTITGSRFALADDARLKVGNGTATVTVDDSKIGTFDTVEVKFKLAFGKLSGKTAYFNMKDAAGNLIGETTFDAYNGKITSTTLGVAIDDIYRDSNTVIWERCVDFDIVINYNTKKITTNTSCLKSGTGKAATTASHVTDLPTGVGALKTFVVGSGYNNDDRLCQVDDIVIDAIEGASVQSYAITTKYVDEQKNQIKDSTVEYVASGSSYTPAYDATFDDDDYRYTYVSNTSIAQVTEAAEVEVVYSKAALDVHDVTVAATGDVEKEFGTYQVKDGKSLTYAFSKLLLDGTTLYSTDKSATSDHYHKTVSNVTSDTVSEHTYSKFKDNVVYFSEGEDIEGVTVREYTNNKIRSSNGKSASADDEDGVLITKLQPGIYNVEGVEYINANAGGYLNFTAGTTTFKVGQVAADFENSRAATNWKDFSQELTVTEPTDLIFKSDNGTICLDYIYIVKTGDYTPEPENYDKGFKFEGTSIASVKAKHLYVTATINGVKKMSDRGTVENLLGTNFTNATANLTVFLSNIPADYENVGVVID